MRIGQNPAATRAGASRKASRAPAGGSTGFSGLVQGGGGSAGESTAVGHMTPLATLGSILALQAEDDVMARRSRALERGTFTLETLEEIRLALLDGSVPRQTLSRLSGLLDQHRADSEDPGLDAVLDEIALRAAVELAKLERDEQPA